MKIVCISDTHRKHEKIEVPDGDVLVHAGDIGCEHGSTQLTVFASWLSRQPHKHKVVIPGNHDFFIEKNQTLAREIMNDHHFLIDEGVDLGGRRIIKKPWQPWFYDWAYNLPRGKALEKVWSWIPDDTDVLITHGPPRNILDRVQIGCTHEGCDDLRDRVMEVLPKLHVFGHIHEGYGQEEHWGVQFVNASSCNFNYQPVNPPIVVEI
jgi:Icc-related predicted phosphoesterase